MNRLTDQSRRRLRSGVPVAALALIAYIPLLLTSPGEVGGDTKSYLTIDPSRWLSRVAFVWQDAIGAGGVTHQNIGYLWPMGPWFWVFDKLGVPMWVAQRLWLGTILFAAGAGVLWLMRRFVDSRIAVAAAFFYMLSPYLLHYSERMSVLLLPWAGLPWMVGLTAKARREGTWKAPALFALLTATIGGINATSIILVGLGPILWLLYTTFLPHSAGTAAEALKLRVRRAFGVAVRIGVLCALTNAWWIGGLRTQGTYGLPVLNFTETYKTVAQASAAQEMLRGFGHWYFYGADRIGAWVRPSVTYTGNLWVLTLSFVVPILALAGLGLVRFRHRTFFLSTTVVGLLAAVGAHPWDAPSVLGGIFKAFTRTESGLALRSTPRALPLMELGLAAGFGAGTAALGAIVSGWWAERAARRAEGTTGAVASDPSLGARSRRSAVPRWIAPGIVALACLLVLANLSPLWTGHTTADSLARKEDLPDYWLQAAAAIDAGNHDTRVLEVPGSDFAAYRWGDIVDPLTPGLVDRPYLARELIPNGEPASAALLLALDRRYQEGIAEPQALVPIAKLFAVGDVVLRNDLQYERFNTPRPYLMWNSLTSAPGLAAPQGFGPDGRNDAQPPQPLLDTIALAEPADQPATPPVSLFRVDGALPISRTVPFASPMVVAGDAEGLVDLAGLGLLDPQQAILYSASVTDDPAKLQAQLDAGATLVVTDTNAKRGLRWGSIRENEGYVERTDESALRWDPSDNTLPVFPGQTTDDQTVAVQGGATVDATAYGNPVSFTPENRPFMAFDGDPTTAWTVGAFDRVIGERIVLTLDAPTTIDHLTLLQAPTSRHITRARVRVGDRTMDVDLGDESRTAPGQVVSFPATEADKVSIEVLATDPGILSSYESQSGVGFAEITVPGVQVTETLRMPTDLLGAVGTDDLGHPLYLMVTRNRADPQANGRQDPEQAMHREVDLPSARSFTTIGDVRLAPAITAEQLASLVGGTDGALVSASSALPGALNDRGRGAFDGDPATWWTPAIGDTTGAWVQIDAPTATGAGALTVTFAADGRHSVPSQLSVQADGATVATVEVPDAPDGGFGTTRSVTIPIPAGTTARSWRLTVDDVHPRMTNPWLGGDDYALPVAIADIGGLPVAPAAVHDTVDTGCRTDLAKVDGTPVPVRVTGTVADALARRPLSLVGCGDLALPAGTITLDTTDGRTTGLDVDRLLLASEAGGGAVPAAASGSMDQVVAALQPQLPSAQPTVTVTHTQPDRVELEVSGLDAKSWLVLGQSFSEGWSASSPELGDLGAPTLIQGYANGWALDPATGTVHITLEWGPQKVVWAGIGVSLLGVPLCLLVLLVPWFRRRRRRRRGRRHGSGAPGTPGSPGGPDGGGDDPGTLAAAPSDLGTTSPAEPASPAIGERWPDSARAPATGWGAPLALGGAVTVFAGVNLPRDHILVTIVMAVVLGAATAAVVRLGRGLAGIGTLAPAALALAGAFTVAKQWHGDYKSFAWPRIFDSVDILGVLAVLALAAVAVISAWRDERVARATAAGSTDEPPSATM
jgi:arabinofuranan 3-O-arabinosyltransferase